MKILIIDQLGSALDFSMRCVRDGHQVRHFIKPGPKTDHIGKGLVPLVREWQPSMRWAELVVLSDNTLYLQELDRWRREGKAIVGATQASAAWELDRTAGQKVFQKCGIDVPPYREFSNYDEAIAYVKKEDRPFVSKPCGDEPDKALSYVAKSPADLVYMLERWKKARRHKGSFILQERVKGIEMAVGAFFGPGGFQTGWCENWEEKKLMNGGLGVATGEQGTTLRFVRASKLAAKVLKPCEDLLARTGHVGYVDVNCIIDDKGTPWPLEWTMRFGWPCFNIQEALHEGDHAAWLEKLCGGKDARNFRLDEVAVGVVLSIPDYPYSHITRKDVYGVPIYGITPGIADLISPCEMMMGSAPLDVGGSIMTTPMMVTAGDYVLVANGTGETVKQAREKAYRVLDRLDVPNSPSYRTDIGMRLAHQIPKLQEMGYASGFHYA